MKADSALYHKDIYLPSGIVELFEGAEFSLDVTNHARQAALSDRYGIIRIPESLTIKGDEIVEALVEAGEVVKIVVRKTYDAARDAVFVLIPNYERATVKTVWFNHKRDSHKTLRVELYAKA